VPWNLSGIKKAGIVGYWHAYIQRQFGWFHSGHHLLADQQIIVSGLSAELPTEIAGDNGFLDVFEIVQD